MLPAWSMKKPDNISISSSVLVVSVLPAAAKPALSYNSAFLVDVKVNVSVVEFVTTAEVKSVLAKPTSDDASVVLSPSISQYILPQLS